MDPTRWEPGLESVRMVSLTCGPVRYCQVGCPGGFPKGKIRRHLEQRLVARLYRDWTGPVEAQIRREVPSQANGLFGRLYNDQWGRPRFCTEGGTELSVSFTFVDEWAWGALCPKPNMVGIDAALSTEFGEDYPFGRAFHLRELDTCIQLCGGNPAEAAATIWSVKEAVVKALGCGFRLLDPLDLEAWPTQAADECLRFWVHFSDRAVQEYPAIASSPVAVANIERSGSRLSFAAVDSQRAVEDCMTALRKGRPPLSVGMHCVPRTGLMDRYW